MAVRLRLRRVGKKKMPMYHIVAADSRSARTGKFLEVVGRYEPMQDPALITTKENRLFYWLRNGALPTDTVRSLLQRNGTWIKWSLTKKGVDEATMSTELEKWAMMQEAKKQREQEKKSQRLTRRKQAKRPAEEGTPGAESPAPATSAENAAAEGTSPA